MLTATAEACRFAASISATCPACSAPMVGTSASFRRANFARSARQAVIVLTTCMRGKVYGRARSSNPSGGEIHRGDAETRRKEERQNQPRMNTDDTDQTSRCSGLIRVIRVHPRPILLLPLRLRVSGVNRLRALLGVALG